MATGIPDLPAQCHRVGVSLCARTEKTTTPNVKFIIVAIVISLVALAYQVADPPVHFLGRKPGTNVFRPRSEEHPKDETFPGLLLLRLEGRIFFANAENIAEKIRVLKPEQSALWLESWK